VTAGWVWVVVAAPALLLGVTAWALWRAVARLGALETARQQPDQALLLLQRDIQTARAEAHQARSETLATVKEELHQFASHMTQQMGQVGSGVQQQLQHVGQVVGAVQGSLGKLGEVTQRVFDVGRDIAGLEQLLKSPKIRGGVGETLLENLLAQMLPREQYALQHAFATGDRVDAAIRIGERIVPVDAKFPLENFRRVLEETDEDKRGPLRRAFLRDVKNRVDEIAKKYILPDEGTFDFALMYIPAENIYYEIIVRDDSEEDSPAAYALARRVVPVSPNTFYAYLRVIVLGLRGLRIERDAQEIQARLGRLRGDLDKFREAFDVVGRHLTNARNKYDDAASAWAGSRASWTASSATASRAPCPASRPDRQAPPSWDLRGIREPAVCGMIEEIHHQRVPWPTFSSRSTHQPPRPTHGRAPGGRARALPQGVADRYGEVVGRGRRLRRGGQRLPRHAAGPLGGGLRGKPRGSGRSLLLHLG